MAGPSLAPRSTLALAAALLPALGCELITHADEYAVYDGLCNLCPRTDELRHPPCPNPSDRPDTGEEYIYAARSLKFGKPVDWVENRDSFALGYDMDCSSRPSGGQPVLCKPRSSDPAIVEPWEPLPRGIDNSLATRILGPLYETAEMAGQEIDLDATYSADQESGRLGTLVIVNQWNGTADDPQVRVSIHSSPGVTEDNGPPRWDGTDQWDLYSDVPGNETKYFTLPDTVGYVAGGVLVVDYRDRGDVSFRFGSPNLSFRIIVKDVAFIGRLEVDSLTNFNMIAVADFISSYETIPEMAKVFATCDPAGEAFLTGKLADLLIGAADLPKDRGRPVDQTCDGISFAWALDAQRALLGGHKDQSSVDAGCL